MIKINELKIENVKRIKAVQLEPKAEGLTIIGGRNNQGKTSVIDAIAWALGGERFRPSAAQREGSLVPPDLRVELSNGLIVERKGKNSELKVTDKNGRRGGQQLLNEFVEQLALDLPRFMQAGGKEKADTLLQIIGVQEQLLALERQEQDLYNRGNAFRRNCPCGAGQRVGTYPAAAGDFGQKRGEPAQARTGGALSGRGRTYTPAVGGIAGQILRGLL